MKRWRRLARWSNEKVGQKHTGRLNKAVFTMPRTLSTLGQSLMKSIPEILALADAKYPNRVKKQET